MNDETLKKANELSTRIAKLKRTWEQLVRLDFGKEEEKFEGQVTEVKIIHNAKSQYEANSFKNFWISIPVDFCEGLDTVLACNNDQIVECIQNEIDKLEKELRSL